MTTVELQPFIEILRQNFTQATDVDVRQCWEMLRVYPLAAAKRAVEEHRLEFGAKVYRPDPKRLAVMARAAAGEPGESPVDRTARFIAGYRRQADESEQHWHQVFALIGDTPDDELATATAAAIERAPALLRASLAKWDARTSRPLAALVYPILTAREVAHA
jgi:hypothetical protein